MSLTTTTILEIRGRFREREGRDGGVALFERGETPEDGGSPGPKAEDPPGSKDLGVQGSDLRSINPRIKTFCGASRGNRGRKEKNEWRSSGEYSFCAVDR